MHHVLRVYMHIYCYKAICKITTTTHLTVTLNQPIPNQPPPRGFPPHHARVVRRAGAGNLAASITGVVQTKGPRMLGSYPTLVSTYLIQPYFPSLPKSSKYLLRRCLEPQKAFSGGVWGSKHLLSRYLED